MSDKNAGTAAQVGYVKRNGEGEVSASGGDFDPELSVSKWAYRIVYLIFGLAVVGLWRLVELLLTLL